MTQMASERDSIARGNIRENSRAAFFRSHNSSFLLLLGILFGLWLFFSIASPHFFSFRNLLDIGRAAAVTGIAAGGVTLALISGSLDLSIASTMSISGVLMALAYQNGLPLVGAILVGLLSGVVVGIVNGLIVTRLGVDAFIATLGMLSVIRGMSFVISKAQNIHITSTLFDLLGRGRIRGVPVPVIALASVFVVLFLFLRLTTASRLSYAIGGNPRACLLSGIRVDRWRTVFFVISGFLAAFAGLILASLIGFGSPRNGEGYELDIIAAVVLGGTALAGGAGTAQGTLVGIIILSSITNGLIILGVSSFWQMVVRGGVLLLAVVLDRLREGKA